MFPDLSGILPKTFVVGAMGYALIAYGCAPFLAERVVRADVMPACEANVRTSTAQAAEERIADLAMPSVDPSRAIAAASLKALRENPLMEQLEVLSGELGIALGLEEIGDLAVGQHVDEVAAARDTYDRALAQIRNDTASKLAGAGDLCGCLADAAIGETRMEWAILAGTLSVVRPAALDGFDARMARLHRAGACAGSDRVAS